MTLEQTCPVACIVYVPVPPTRWTFQWLLLLLRILVMVVVVLRTQTMSCDALAWVMVSLHIRSSMTSALFVPESSAGHCSRYCGRPEPNTGQYSSRCPESSVGILHVQVSR